MMRRFLYIVTSAIVIGACCPTAASAAAVPGLAEIQPAGPGQTDSQPAGPGQTDSQPAGPGQTDSQPVGPGLTGAQPATGPIYGFTTDDKEYGPGFVNGGTGADVSQGVIPDNNFLDSPSRFTVGVTDRYSYDQMVQDMQRFQANYPDKVQLNVIGTSHDGRSIYEMIVGNVNAPKHILIQGGIHAREYMTPLLMMRQAETALINYDTGIYDGMRLSDMFSQAAIHFIPMSNPDGIMLSEFGLNGIRSDFLKQAILTSYAQDTSLGRTSQPLDIYLQRWKANGAGVDLNQNFPANWEGVQTSATMTSYAGYKGTAPLSEPESQALASMADRYPWAAAISYHSMGNIIYWDANTSRAKDTSKALADTISTVTGYKLDGSDGRGGFKDWMQSKENPVPSVTIEVGSVACPMPVSEYQAVWKQNKAVWAQTLAHVIRN